jgi:large subunit ribosomal protein L15
MSGELSKLQAPKGANRPSKRVGRGIGSGHGKQSTRGGKGQKARKSGNVRTGFEGGQMPLQRRLPKTGFKNPFTQFWAEVNLADLNRFDLGASVDMKLLREAGVVKGKWDGVKILGTGELTKKVNVTVNRITKSAKARIEQLGGAVELIPDREKWKRTDTRAAKRAAKKK